MEVTKAGGAGEYLSISLETFKDLYQADTPNMSLMYAQCSHLGRASKYRCTVYLPSTFQCIFPDHADPTLHDQQHMYQDFADTVGKFVTDEVKKLANKVLRPIGFLGVSTLPIHKSVPRDWSWKQILNSDERTPEETEQAANCTQAIAHDEGMCIYVENEGNNSVPMHERTEMSMEECAANPKCDVVTNDDGEDACEMKEEQGYD